MSINILVSALLILIHFSCNNLHLSNYEVKSKYVNKVETPPCDLAKQITLFRNVVLGSDTLEMANYFSFPLRDNHIWNLVYLLSGSPSSGEKVGFNFDDFMLHHKQIFNEDLKKGLADVDISELVERGKCISDVFQRAATTDREGYRFTLSGTMNESKDKIELNVNYEFPEGNMVYETSVIYYLIVSSCEIKIDKVLVIG